MTTPLYLGIDIAKATLQAALWHDGQPLDLGAFPNDLAGFDALAEQLQPHAARLAAEGVHLVVEPTGGYQDALVGYALAQGWRVSLPNPKLVREWANGLGRRAKTDKEDARLLARFAAERNPPPHQPLRDEISALDSLLKRRDDLQSMIRQERNRLEALRLRRGQSPEAVRSVERAIEFLESELAAVEQALTSQLAAHPDLQAAQRRLLTLPGIGPKTVLPLLVFLARWDALTDGLGDAKGLTAYAGLDPQPYESGTSVHRRPTISRMGDRRMRHKLYMAALGGIHGHNPLRAFYLRLVGRGKRKRLALVAAARKLLVWALAIWRAQTVFDPARLEAPSL